MYDFADVQSESVFQLTQPPRAMYRFVSLGMKSKGSKPLTEPIYGEGIFVFIVFLSQIAVGVWVVMEHLSFAALFSGSVYIVTSVLFTFIITRTIRSKRAASGSYRSKLLLSLRTKLGLFITHHTNSVSTSDVERIRDVKKFA